jgi:pyruvate dehydrogenase E2 component (dihydrolipoamide acetyltransferase)
VFTWKGIHLGIAVDTDDGLTVAVLRNAQGLDLAQIAERTRDLVEKARAGKLSAEERRHPTFTISNLGMLDVEHFQPIINPPSSVTLGVSSALPSPVVEGDSIHIGQVMRLTMSCDHRIVDGATAARFLNAMKTLLEDPDALL